MEKMNLLICDDEWMIRESIVQTALSMEEFNVFTAVTGRTALELLEEEEIDGVVLDMQMPEMDGITFLQHMKSRKKDCAVIVLSGHDEFDYAQKCLHYGAIEYLLKPVTSEQIRDFLMQLKENILHKRSYISQLNTYRQEIDSIKPLLREQFFQDLLQKSPDNETIHRMEHFLGLQICFPYLITAAIHIGHSAAAPDAADEPLQLYTLGKLIGDQLNHTLCSHIFHMNSDTIAVIAGGSSDSLDDDLLSAFDELAASLISDLHLRMNIGIGGVVTSVRQIRDSYTEALFALNFNNYSEMVSIISIHDISEHSPSENVHWDLKKSLDKLTAASATADKNEFLLKLQELLQQLKEHRDINLNSAIHYCCFISSLALGCLDKNEELMNRNPYFETSSQTTLDSLYAYTEQLLEEISERIKSGTENRICHLADACCEILEKNYKEKLNIREIARELGISRNYLSTIFRSKTGYSIVEYLNGIRLEAAKRLLRNNELKIYEIAEETGFSDTYYFSKVFKTHTGVSPSDYRNSFIE